MTEWQPIIGLEVHAQLKTQSKLFSGAPTHYGAEANTQACVIDLAYPGVLPVLNEAVLELAIRFGLAINATIPSQSIFARKNYFYPDLPKGYQISQYDKPIIQRGFIPITLTDGSKKDVEITRAHLEEDAGKSIHDQYTQYTALDLNRAGTPLLEIVSEPTLYSAEEAVAYLKKLHSLLRYLDVCDGNMQEGSFRVDANVSVKPKAAVKLGTRTEIKNLNSFRYIEKAIDYEIERQISLLEMGECIRQETRLYNPDNNQTKTMRVKEDADDYRYFPDPDLLPVFINQEMIEDVKASMPELPAAKSNRYQTTYGLAAIEAEYLVQSKETADYFEKVMLQAPKQAKLAVNWIRGELAANLNKYDYSIEASPVTPHHLAGIIQKIADGSLSSKLAKILFDAVWVGEENGNLEAIIAKHGLVQVTDNSLLEQVCNDLVAAHPAQVAEFRAGKEKIFGFFVGQAMKQLKGKANPETLNRLLKDKLKS